VYSKKIPDDGQRDCPKHVEIYSKNKFEKSVHLVGFIIRIYHDARSPKTSKSYDQSCKQLRIITQGQERKKRPTENKMKED
jgi:hypothetical protein